MAKSFEIKEVKNWGYPSLESIGSNEKNSFPNSVAYCTLITEGFLP